MDTHDPPATAGSAGQLAALYRVGVLTRDSFTPFRAALPSSVISSGGLAF